MILGIWCPYNQERLPLVASRYSVPKWVLMARWNVLRPVWLPKTLRRSKGWIIVIPSLQLLKWPLFAYFSLWLPCVIGRSINWILRMPFFTVICKRRFIWSNHLVLLLRGVQCSLQTQEVSLWSETISTSMVWQVQHCGSSLWSHSK